MLPSNFTMHTSCPQCPSSDAFAVYDDGHGHCFSCHYHRPSDALKQMEAAASAHLRDMTHNPGIKTVKDIVLPWDVSKTIDAKALAWLNLYGITREEIIKYDIRWSPSRHWLVFPYDGVTNDLVAYQARCFPQLGETKVDKKWMTFGPVSDVMLVLGADAPTGRALDSPVVIVEDIISAIKVARHTRAMPLFGSFLSPQKLLRLHKFFTKKIVMWLDADKYAEAISSARRAEMIGIATHVLYTSGDPKDYSDHDVKALLTNL
jgi:hypothetical protein